MMINSINWMHIIAVYLYVSMAITACIIFVIIVCKIDPPPANCIELTGRNFL
nr:MAG TPA: hypothetical protein [Inoviridae sp.]